MVMVLWLFVFIKGNSLSEYGSESFWVRLRRLSEHGSVACLVERPAREEQAEQCSDTVLLCPQSESSKPVQISNNLREPPQKTKSSKTNMYKFAPRRPCLMPSVLMFLGPWTPPGSCDIMWNHGKSCKSCPWFCLQMPESAWFCLRVPDFVPWERLEVPDAQKPENQETWICFQWLSMLCRGTNLHKFPVVQMALQTDKNVFGVIYAFHTRYRYRGKLFWN